MEELTSESSENMSSSWSASRTEPTWTPPPLNCANDRLHQISLPEDCGAPMVMTLNPDLLPVSMITMQGKPLNELQTLAEDSISPALERIDGVASVTIYGGYEMEIAVDTYPSRLAGYNLSVSYIAQMLAANNTMIPAGTWKRAELPVRPHERRVLLGGGRRQHADPASHRRSGAARRDRGRTPRAAGPDLYH
jgi:HAE1 family hydrophobic/amphiphilic exporter-1